MAELLVKIAYALFAVKSFHIYDIRIPISVPTNCIGIIYLCRSMIPEKVTWF